MEKRIIVKEVDRLASALHKGRFVSEYLIYIMCDNQTGGEFPLEAFTEFGEGNKRARVNELILTHFISEENVFLNHNEIIEEIKFETYAKELKTIWKK